MRRVRLLEGPRWRGCCWTARRCQKGNVDAVRLLLEKGASVNQGDRGRLDAALSCCKL